MNPYYATGFITALFFWVWPVFIYKTLEAHWLLAGVMAAAIFAGLGLAATQYHVHVAAKKDAAAQKRQMLTLCAAIVAAGLLTRIAHRYLVGQ
jgi:hypothetical protein